MESLLNSTESGICGNLPDSSTPDYQVTIVVRVTLSRLLEALRGCSKEAQPHIWSNTYHVALEARCLQIYVVLIREIPAFDFSNT